MNNNDDGTINIKGFDYDDLVEESLKNVVKKVLKITAESGLVGNSHFFISFNGNDDEVIVPDVLKSTDSSEIKIIIQHQFWDLKATDEHFDVVFLHISKFYYHRILILFFSKVILIFPE